MCDRQKCARPRVGGRAGRDSRNGNARLRAFRRAFAQPLHGPARICTDPGTGKAALCCLRAAPVPPRRLCMPTTIRSRTLAAAALLSAAAALSPQAGAQGVVNALCSTDAPWCEAAAAEFTRTTGIKVNQAHKGTGEIGAQLRAEAANPKTDIWWGGTGDPFLQAAEQGLLDSYRPAYIKDLHDWSVRQYDMSGNRVGGFYTSTIGFGYNTEVLQKKNLPEPKCWADLIKPEYKGEVEISHPASSGTAYTVIAGLVQ